MPSGVGCSEWASSPMNEESVRFPGAIGSSDQIVGAGTAQNREPRIGQVLQQSVKPHAEVIGEQIAPEKGEGTEPDGDGLNDLEAGFGKPAVEFPGGLHDRRGCVR